MKYVKHFLNQNTLIKSLVVMGVVASLLVISQYLYVLPIHIATFCITIAAVVVADLHGLLWVLGKMPTLPQKRMVLLHHAISFGLLVAIVTGVIMTYPVYEYLLGQPAFIAKMILVGALVVNSFVIASHMQVAFTSRFQDVPRATRLPLYISGFVSASAWAGAFIAAQFLGLS